MKLQIKEQFPQWCADFTQGQNSLILTDDLDSLMGCAIEKSVKGNSINYYYSFNNLHIINKNDKRKAIGIDLALHKGKSWCNHVVKITPDDYTNPQTANLNVINDIYSNNYTKKYAMSTTLLMMSYYDIPLPKSKEGKMLLLAIDSGFLGHYNDFFKVTHTNYLETLGYIELIDLLNNTKQYEFYEIQKQYKTKEKIILNNEGFLQTEMALVDIQGLFDFNLTLPKEKFILRNEFTSYRSSTLNYRSKEEIPHLISFALTKKNEFKYTTI